ncbi:YhfH family protein [Robertmurraya korlensis]|nr:protein YhfH [Robertmurraya korlensis]MCM3601576.1 YhfH family protein [Robertmurraya korlensis]
MLMSPVEFFRTLPKKVCPECGQHVHEQAESYIQECDRCLSKKMEE